MKTQWDYSELADAYLERPAYSQEVLDDLCSVAGLEKGCTVCDIGAGVAHLTIPFAEKGFTVDAVEPNDAMRNNGIKRTAGYANVTWYEGVGEDSGRPSSHYDAVSFGSSFNVCDRSAALKEAHRILNPGGWFTCLWNHRDLTDPIQENIESIIAGFIPAYEYGTRREDQTQVIEDSGLFVDIGLHSGRILHSQAVEKAIDAWRSHATLHRQAGGDFHKIIAEIERYLLSLGEEFIAIPYTTQAWIARKRD
jgi:ubiquinone/menaquinone biosynthesis C-methylase UbiE